MSYTTRTSVAFVTIALCMVLACSSDARDAVVTSEVRITASEGGELRASDDSFVLSVPPGAVSEDVTISFESVSVDSVPGELADGEATAFELKPDGLQFARPVKLTLALPFDELDIDEAADEVEAFDLVSVSGDGEVSGLENVTNTFNTADETLTLSGEVSHFSWIVRSKSGLIVRLEQADPAERALGSTVNVEGSITTEIESTLRFDTGWEFAVAGSLNLLTLDPKHEDYFADSDDEATRLAYELNGLKATSARNVAINQSIAIIPATVQCVRVGAGFYSLNVDARPVSRLAGEAPSRNIKVSLTARIDCVTVSDAVERATATAATGSALATATAQSAVATINALPTSTPAPIPTATATPAIDRGEEKLRLVLVAATDGGAPGTNDSFSFLASPTAGGGYAVFRAVTSEGNNGIWVFEEDDLIGSFLSNLLVTVSQASPGQPVFINSEPIPVTGDGVVAYIARFKTGDGFQNRVTRASLEFDPPLTFPLFSQGASAPGQEAGSEFNEFDWVQMADVISDQITATGASASSEGVWLTEPGKLIHIASEGQELPGLAPGWTSSGGNPIVSAGLTFSGSVAIYLEDYFTNDPASGSETGSGIWLIGPAGVKRIVQTGMPVTDETEFTRILDPSVNSRGDVAFYAEDNVPLDIEINIDASIWKVDSDGMQTRMASWGDVVPETGLEILNFRSPLILEDGRVVFVAEAADLSGTLTEYILASDGSNIEIIARLDALPGPEGQISVFPFQVQGLSVNRFGHVAFEIGFGDEIWVQSPGGFLHRVIKRGDELQLPTLTGSVTKTVNLVHFVGGANTEVGRPNAYTDGHDLAFKVTFTDGSEAIYWATFDEEPVTG